MKDEAEWSRKLAYAMSVHGPDLDMRKKLIDAYAKAETPSRLPQWFKDYVASAYTADKFSHAVITKAGRNAIDVALAKLDDIPMVDDKHISVPWPITERPKLDPEVERRSKLD